MQLVGEFEPVIDEGFYYDIAYERPFTPDDLAAIEQRMHALIEKDYDVIKKVTPRAEVIDVFTARGEDYKLRLVEDMPEEQAMGLYYHEEYVDMCRGPGGQRPGADCHRYAMRCRKQSTSLRRAA